MNERKRDGAGARRKRPRPLHIWTTIYALLYLLFIIDSFLPLGDSRSGGGGGLPLLDAEGIIVRLLFLLFVVGYVFSWRHDGAAGLIFVLWYALMCGLSFALPRVLVGGGGVAMGLPLFVLGILYLVAWFRRRRHAAVLDATL